MPPTDDGKDDHRDRWVARCLVVATAVAVTICRLYVASQAQMPKGPDVVGPWAIAFHIARAPINIDMYDLPPYSVGLGVLLSPLVPLIDDPVARYRTAVALLGMSSLVAGWCMARFVRASSNAGPLQAASAFCVTAAITAVAFTSTFTWAEPLVLVWLCAWLALAAWAWRSDAIWPTLLVALFACTAPLVHGRVVLIPAIWCLAVVVRAAAARRSGAARSAATALPVALGVIVITAAGTLLAQRFRSSVLSAVWSSPDLANDTQILTNVGDPDYWGAVIIEAVGQIWYATSSTFGLAPIGVIALVGAIAGRTASLSSVQRQLCGVALAGLLSVWGIGVLFVAGALTAPGPDRLDYLVYGRYGEQAVIAFAACGAAYLLGASRRHAMALLGAAAALLIATGAVVRWRLNGLDEARFAVNEGVISGVASFPLDRPGLDLVRWSVIGLAAIAVLTLSRLGGRITLAVAITAIVILGGVTGSVRAVSEHRAWDNSVLYADYPAAPTRPSRVPVATDTLDGLAYSFNMASQQYALAGKGWQFEVVPGSSAEVGATLTPNDQMVVLRYTAGAPGDDWCYLSRYDDIIVWVRTSVRAGAPGGECGI